MPSLVELQQNFLEAFYQEKEEMFTRHILNKSALTPKLRFAIYRGSITECLAKSLRETYQACEKLVGEDFFNGLAYTFVEQTPSSSPNLADYGESFADFIASFPAAKQLPYLADVCRLCWFYHLAYQGKVDKPFDAKAFSVLPDDRKAQVIFQLPIGAYILQSPYPLKAIWEMCQFSGAAQEIDLDIGGAKLLIWRNQDSVIIDELNQNEWFLAQQLVRQPTLEQLQNVLELQHLSIDELLPAFLAKGCLTSRNL